MYRSGRAGCLSAVITRIVAFTLPVGAQKKSRPHRPRRGRLGYVRMVGKIMGMLWRELGRMNWGEQSLLVGFGVDVGRADVSMSCKSPFSQETSSPDLDILPKPT